MFTTPPELMTLLKAQSGDLVALDEVLRSVQQPVFGYLVRLTGDKSLSKDILQEVFLLIFKKISTLRNPQLFRAWVFRLASREAFRQLKKQRMTIWEPVDDHPFAADIPEPAEDAFWLEKLDELPELIQQLSPASRAVVLLHFLEGMKLTEIAEALDLPHGTVKSRLGYGLFCLRNKFGII